MKTVLVLFSLFLIPILFGNVYAHTIDSIDDKYRIEIGWMNEPVVSGETNGIELLISPLKSCPEISESIKCAESQEFQNGVPGLEDTLKMQLVFKSEKITLPLDPDHNVPGKYYAFVNPTVSGYYQANILGKIDETVVSLSMHPPKVDERKYIEFPEPTDMTINQIIDGHTALIANINELRESVNNLQQSTSQYTVGYAGIVIGMVAITISIIAIFRYKK